jgi:hypothetical protein
VLKYLLCLLLPAITLYRHHLQNQCYQKSADIADYRRHVQSTVLLLEQWNADVKKWQLRAQPTTYFPRWLKQGGISISSGSLRRLRTYWQGSITLEAADLVDVTRRLLRVPYGVIVWRSAEIYTTKEAKRVVLGFDWVVDVQVPQSTTGFGD